MIDLDYSFIRLRDNLTDAMDMDESPQATICYNTQIRLAKGETYLQISNSPTSIVFNGNYEVHLVDACDNVVEDITSNVFIEERQDSNGLWQIAWEYVCNSEHYYRPLSFRFTNTTNQNKWYSNLVLITEDDKKFTNRLDYKHFRNLEGTDYTRFDFYQSVRVSFYFRNPINDDTREEYHEITTRHTAALRNIKKRKRRYLLNEIDNWTADRIDNAATCSNFYLDGVKHTSTTPVEFNEPELDSNIYENELILNPIPTDKFTASLQILEGLELVSVTPSGTSTSCGIEATGTATFSANITLNTGTVTLYSASDDSVVSTFTESDLSVSGSNLLIPNLNADELSLGGYYIHISEGLVSLLGIPFEGISDNTTWAFSVANGDFDRDDFDNSDFLTDCPAEDTNAFNTVFNNTFA